MTEKEFRSEMLEALKRVASDNNCVIELQKANKVNYTDRESVCLRNMETDISPNVYMDEMYKQYQNGISIQEQARRIEMLLKNTSQQEFNLDISEEMIMENCFPQIIGKNNNEELLKTVPYRTVADDMALIVRVDVGDSGSFIVNDNLLQRYKISKNELLDRVIDNLTKKPYELKSLGEMVEHMIGTSQQEIPNVVPKIMVLTNVRNVYGATEIINQKAMKEALTEMDAEKNGCLIIPSSLHEVLLVPIQEGEDVYAAKESLKEMVRAVNDSTLNKSDLLSYSVYYCNPRSLSISNADTCDLSFDDNEKHHISRHM